MKHRGTADRYLGVRLEAADLERLDQLVASRGFPTRSQAIRHLLMEASAPEGALRAPGERAPRGRSVELPITLFRELERSVENGYSTSVESALEKGLERGLDELAARRSRRTELERDAAQRLAKEEAERRGASQEGERHGGA